MSRQHLHAATILTWALLLFAGLLGCGGAPDPGATALGGSGKADVLESPTFASSLDVHFPATVRLPDCTGAKVGPRHFLTAAHCVVDDRAMALLPAFGAGASLTLYSGEDLDAEAIAHPVRVRGTFVHPSYREAVLGAGGAGLPKADYDRVFDLALIVTDDPTPDIAVGRLDHRRLTTGDGIYIGGYGAEVVPAPWWSEGGFARDTTDDDVGGASEAEAPSGRLRYRRTAVADASGTVNRIHNGRFVEGAGWVVSNGFDAGDEIRLRPGDSGGPVMLDDAPEPTVAGQAIDHLFTRIVGVNSFTGPLQSSLVRLDLPAARDCLAAALGDDEPPAPTDALPSLCGR